MFRVVEGGRYLEEPMKVAVKLKAQNDDNGNPRRGWLVYSLPDAECLGWVEENYDGEDALKKEHPEAIVLCAVNVPVTEYEMAKEDY